MLYEIPYISKPKKKVAGYIVITNPEQAPKYLCKDRINGTRKGIGV